MAALSNPKREKFAQGLARGMTPEAAYSEAGYSPHRQNAHRMMTDDDVMMRVAELQERVAERVVYTAAKLVEMAAAVYEQAYASGQNAAAVAAIKEIGILTGERVEKRENTNRNIRDMSDDELIAIAAGGRAGAVGPPPGTGKPH